MAKILKRIMDIILIIIIIFLIGYFILRLTNVIVIYNVETGSMENNIHPGDYVLVHKTHNYVVGDIITFKKENYLVTHRIIHKDNDSIITKGDANNTEDEAINKNEIIGKVVLIGGLLNLVIKYKYTIVGLFLVIYLFSCYFDKNKKNDIINNEDRK